MTLAPSPGFATHARSLRHAMPTRTPSWAWLAVALSVCFGCAGGGQQSAPAEMPADAALRRSSLLELGQRLFEGLRDGALEPSFATMRELDVMLLPEARLRLERERAGWSQRRFALEPFRNEWSRAGFVGFCAQGARAEPPRAGLGLTHAGWVLDRILVVARPDTAGPRSAAWLEGDFVYTEQGWRVLSLRRLEPPRRHHSDLELAPCDVEAGLR
ncbi:MAG TPA: hypothetical protein VFZ61_07530 [Polyangiales bacterium]